jgi:hypothetical protein
MGWRVRVGTFTVKADNCQIINRSVTWNWSHREKSNLSLGNAHSYLQLRNCMLMSLQNAHVETLAPWDAIRRRGFGR